MKLFHFWDELISAFSSTHCMNFFSKNSNRGWRRPVQLQPSDYCVARAQHGRGLRRRHPHQ